MSIVALSAKTDEPIPPLGALTLHELRKVGKPIYALDWKPHQLDVCPIDSVSLSQVDTIEKSLYDFVESHPNSVLIFERTTESYDPEKRNASIELANRINTWLFTINQRHTHLKGTIALIKGIHVRDVSDEDMKNDKYAALAIAAVARGIDERYVLHRYTPYSLASETVRERYERIRRGHSMTLRKYVVTELPSLRRLKSDDPLSYSFVASMIPALHDPRASSSRRFLNAVVAAHGSGHPSYYRSQYERRVMTLTKRTLKIRSLNGVPMSTWKPVFRKHGREVRHALAELYHIFKSANELQCSPCVSE
jgi:hypothetical protein